MKATKKTEMKATIKNTLPATIGQLFTALPCESRYEYDNKVHRMNIDTAIHELLEAGEIEVTGYRAGYEVFDNVTKADESIALLNAVKDLLVKFANENGISLADEFGTVDEFKKFTIAFAFKALTDMGVEVKEAYDMVFGNGKYDELADRVWNENQPAKAATGYNGYYPEMGEARPEAEIEASLAHYGRHYFLDTPLTLKGRGVTFIKTYTDKDLVPGSRKVGWNEYKVTTRAFDAICKKYSVACEHLLD